MLTTLVLTTLCNRQPSRLWQLPKTHMPAPPPPSPLPPTCHLQPEPDGLVGALSSSYHWLMGMVNMAVANATNAFLSSPLAPYSASRSAVENCVRGGIALLSLVLLKSVLSVSGVAPSLFLGCAT